MASINHQYNKKEVNVSNFLLQFLPKKEVKFSSWLYELKSSLHFDELKLQSVIAKKIQEHLPNYNIIYYNKTIVSTLDSTHKNKPDFLMWKKDYTEWYVIEVELKNHSIEHVEEQISTFYHGDYRDVETIYAYVNGKKQIDKLPFIDMISSKRPKIMLIADHVRYEWEKEFKKYNCTFGSIQIYCDEHENFTYRFNGDWPQEYSNFTICKLDKFNSTFNISNPSFFRNFGLKSGDNIDLYYRGIASKWEYLFDEQAEFIIYLEDYLDIDLTQDRWKIIRNAQNQFHLLKF